MQDAVTVFQQQRDLHHPPDYQLITGMSHLEAPPPPEVLALMGAMIGNQSAIDRYLQVIAGVLPVQEFFAPENIEAIILASALELAA